MSNLDDHDRRVPPGSAGMSATSGVVAVVSASGAIASLLDVMSPGSGFPLWRERAHRHCRIPILHLPALVGARRQWPQARRRPQRILADQTRTLNLAHFDVTAANADLGTSGYMSGLAGDRAIISGSKSWNLGLKSARSGMDYGAEVLRPPVGNGQSATFNTPLSEFELGSFQLRIFASSTLITTSNIVTRNTHVKQIQRPSQAET